MAKRVAVVGAALSDCGRVDTKSPFELHYQAASRAIAEAGLSKADIDGFGSTGLGILPPVEVAEYLGIRRPTWVDGTGVGGSTWEFMVGHACEAIQAGHAEVIVLVYGSTARADLKAKRRTANLAFGGRGPSQFDLPYGHTIMAKYAMTARRHMHEFGTTVDQLAEIAVSTRYNAGFNPDAYYREPITREDVHNSQVFADPLTKLHCCIRSDGGGAVVLTSEERAKDLRLKPIYVLGTGECINQTTMSEWDDFTESPAVQSGRDAFRRAGITPADVDICELYDAFTSMVLLTFEGLGFCGKGEGGPFVEDGKMRLGGALPTNTDGGGLSACHPGMRGMFLLVEAVKQLRGECGERQVPNAKIACASGTGGWFTSSSTVLLGVD